MQYRRFNIEEKRIYSVATNIPTAAFKASSVDATVLYPVTSKAESPVVALQVPLFSVYG